ncbi:MAG: sugar phosphate isomerase/epimerase [Clostridiales bacterium]|nr:sugar phosphate isomerase/epimerase [Clostridiales bacterium]
MRPLGLYLWFGYELPPERSLSLIRAAGFDAVMLWWGRYGSAPAPWKQAEEARRLGLSVASAHFPDDSCNALWLSGGEGEERLSRLLAALTECAGVGVDTLVFHLTDGAAAPPLSSIGLSRLQTAVEAARRCGVRLAFENLRYPWHLEEVLDRFPEEHAGLCYDSGHAFSSPRPLLLPGRFRRRLLALHLHDNDGGSDQHLLPFDGSGDWAAVMRMLRESGYTGPLCLEAQAQVYESALDAPAFLARAYRAAARLRTLTDGEYPPSP